MRYTFFMYNKSEILKHIIQSVNDTIIMVLGIDSSPQFNIYV
ncbi:hypothetical protein QCM_0646 [Clostridioides difficile CD46]|nr:hypothetical protein QCM_0646 [Clostridioides difficile CD46]